MHGVQRRLSACRNEIKGVAILWVIFFHAQLQLSGFAYDVQKIGYGGVDLFVFLSGYGLYHSLSKNSGLGEYLKRRATRLLPVYLPFCLMWLAVMLPLYNLGLAGALRVAAGNLTMLAGFAGFGQRINWYPSLLLLTLLIAPFLHAAIRPGRRFGLRACALLAGLFLCGLAFIGNDNYMIFSRLPIFALGMIFAAPAEGNTGGKKLSAGLGIGFALGLAALYVCFARYPDLLNDYAMYWHPFVLIAPALCAGLGWLFDKLPAAVRRPFAALGRASFELFLFNAWLEVLGKQFGLCKKPADWLVWSLAGIAAGLAYHFLVGKIVQKVVDNKS